MLTALAAAQGLGFRHWDLRLKNIMEHRGGWLCRRTLHHRFICALQTSVCIMHYKNCCQQLSLHVSDVI